MLHTRNVWCAYQWQQCGLQEADFAAMEDAAEEVQRDDAVVEELSSSVGSPPPVALPAAVAVTGETCVLIFGKER